MTIATDNTGGFISLMVPAEHYGEMVRHLAALVAESAPSQPAESTSLVRTPSGRIRVSSRPYKAWTVDELQQLKLDTYARRPLLVPLFELMVARPGELVSMTDYEAATGKTRRQLSSALAGFSQRIGKRFERRNWPFSHEWNAGESGEQSYFMTPEQAQAWMTA
jgi:hypothetical protein